MKNNPQLKAVKSETPKTPGGISKSLLTPCRRVGLSRNWKKAGPSPFISPLSGSATPKDEDKVGKKESRKRKERVESEENEDQCTPEKTLASDGILDVDVNDLQCKVENEDLTSTPTRHIEVPRKKRSKTLLSALNKNVEVKESLRNETVVSKDADNQKDDTEKETTDVVIPLQKCRSKGKRIISPKKTTQASKENLIKDAEQVQLQDSNAIEKQDENVVLVQKSKSKENKKISLKSSPKCNKKLSAADSDNIVEENIDSSKNQVIQKEKEVKPTSPKELTKECIVVIQKKIFKTDKKKKANASKTLQVDSDSDDVPLGQLDKEKTETSNQNKLDTEVKLPETTNVQETINVDDEDFAEMKKPKIKKLEDKATSIGGLKKKPRTKPKPQISASFQTQNDCDDDDFDFDNKKTILIRKTYEKVTKPQKAKSTGSITQKDIDELRARIEAKKKMLLARAMTGDTEELRTLIKKWQKGCQDALMELMDLMKTKFPDKQNLDYSEMLSMLKIPTNLVGYDAENDCFITPEDSNIILSQFNDEV